MQIHVKLIKSFTKDKESGNPAGVVVDANHLTDNQILKITQELGFGESAFLQKSDVADYKLRLFSVVQEVNSCITATLAAAFLITENTKKKKVVFETRLGNREISIQRDGLLLMKQPPVEYIQADVDRKKVASLLHITEDKLLEYPLEIASVGTPKLLIPIKSLQDLFSIKPDLEGISQYCLEIRARGFYPFTLGTKKPDVDFHARQFNPLDGIAEDPVTGVAAAVLANYLRKHRIVNKNRIIGEQGYIIDTPGEIAIEIRDNVICVGGYAVEFGEKILKV